MELCANVSAEWVKELSCDTESLGVKPLLRWSAYTTFHDMRPVELPRVQHVRLPFIMPETGDDESEDEAFEEEELMRIGESEMMRLRVEPPRVGPEKTGMKLRAVPATEHHGMMKDCIMGNLESQSCIQNGEVSLRNGEVSLRNGEVSLRNGEVSLRNRENPRTNGLDLSRTEVESMIMQEEVQDRGVSVISDREVLLNYYNELLLQNEISECKRRKVSESDSSSSINNNGSEGILNLSVETRNGESALDSPISSTGDQSEGDMLSPAKSAAAPESETPSPPTSQPTEVSTPTALPSGPEQGSYPCPKCEKSFAYMGNLKRHIKMHHGEYRPYKCHMCVKRFWGNDSLEQHIKRVHSREKPYECAHCDKKYSVCYDLQKHVRSVHGKDIDWSSSIPSKTADEVPKTPTGEKCKVTGIKTQALDQLNFKCKFCGRGFATVNGLGVHLKMHFRCKVCFKGFNTEESLRIHLQKAHDIVGEQEYVL